jgi:ubiquitin carboxyl-terminal hydrolase 4/11/15
MNMSKWTDSGAVYDLYGSVCHHGNIRKAIYTAYAHNLKTKGWYKFDESSARLVKETDAISPHAYLLFYKLK